VASTKGGGDTRILILTAVYPTPEIGGIGSHVYNLGMQLVQRGHEVTVISRSRSMGSSVENVEGMKIYGVRFIPLYPFHIHIHGFLVKQLRKKLGMPDVVNVHTPLCPNIETRSPIVATVHTPMRSDVAHVELVAPISFLTKIQASLVSYRLEQRLIRESRRILAVSRSVARELGEYGVSSRDVRIVGNGVDTDFFSFAKNREESQKYILYAGRLAHRKGLFDLLQAGKILCKEDPKLQFYVTGTGPLRSTIERNAKLQGLEVNFRFLGHVAASRLVKLYQDATVFVLPSHYEGAALTVMEAMACGAPVVATRTGNVPHLITHRKNGLMVHPKEPNELAAAISELLDDRKLREKVRWSARRIIEKKYTWQKVAERYESCLDEIVA